MQFTPDNSWKEKRISLIEKIPDCEILTRVTGREEINLNPHSHNRHQIIYILSGTLHIEAGGKNHFVTERHLVWIPEGTVHRLSSNNRQISLLVGYFHADSKADDSFDIFRTDEMSARNLDFISCRRRINMQKSPEIYSFAYGFLCAIPHICKKASFPSQSFIITDDSRLSAILEYIKSNISQDLTIEQVATQFGLSTRSLTRIFTNSNIRFLHYLNYQRVVRAIEIISDGAMNIEQTAYEVGFNSPNSFSRVFKQITGESPSGYFRK